MEEDPDETALWMSAVATSEPIQKLTSAARIAKLVLLRTTPDAEILGRRSEHKTGESKVSAFQLPRSASHLSELLQVELQGLHVHVEAQRGHGEQDVLAVDGLPLLLVAALARLRRDEADELAHALLHALLGVFRDLRGQKSGGTDSSSPRRRRTFS